MRARGGSTPEFLGQTNCIYMYEYGYGSENCIYRNGMNPHKSDVRRTYPPHTGGPQYTGVRLRRLGPGRGAVYVLCTLQFGNPDLSSFGGSLSQV